MEISTHNHSRLPRIFETFRTDKEQRDFIASGTAAGISAGIRDSLSSLMFQRSEHRSEEFYMHWKKPVVSGAESSLGELSLVFSNTT